MDDQASDRHWVYQITVQGRLDESWSSWLSGMLVSMELGDDGLLVTVLTGPVVDQAALRGILTRLWDLNLTLISVNRMSEGSSLEEANL